MAKIISTLAILCILQNVVFSQDFKFGFLVEFSDKNNSEYSVNNPNEFISQRAIQRRQKNSIAITEQDFPVNKTYTDSLLTFNAKLHVTSRWLNSAVFLTNDTAFTEFAKNCSFVIAVSLIYENPYMKKANKLVSKWTINYDTAYYGDSYNQLQMCNAHKMHNLGYRGDGIQIAVLDGGFWRVNELSCFDSLWQNNQILDTWDFVTGDSSVFEDNNHGMGVLSAMGGNMPNQLMGSAPHASYYLYRTENVATEYPIEEENWLAGAEKADSAGADIITASLGYSIFDNSSMSHLYEDMDGKTTRITRGAEIAFTKGIFVLNSAGNEGNNNWYHITAPSDGENVLCVGAVDSDGDLVNFSSRGPSADDRVKPDLVTKGYRTTLILSNGEVGTGSGTSFACPLLAGMVACLWQSLPNYSNKQLLTLMRKIGDRYSKPDNDYGYGIPNFDDVIDNLGIRKDNSTNDYQVFPNPFNQSISIQFYSNNSELVQFSLYNLQGQELFSKNIISIPQTFNSIDINDLPNLNIGCYLVKITAKSGTFTSKMIKN